MLTGTMTVLTAADGHKLDAYVAQPAKKPKGGLVIIQEIFGINDHMKRVTDEYAAAGYLCVLPAMYDRVARHLIFAYTDILPGREVAMKLTAAQIVADLAAASHAVADAGPVVPMGYCWGGAQAYLAACELDGIAGAVDYYGTRTIDYCAQARPRVPVQYHFGALDKSIPAEGIAKIKAADPSGEFYVYDGADHGFACEERPMFNAEVAALAKARTLAFLNRVMS